MVAQILNFGLPAPIDVQVVGNDLQGNRQYADALLAKIRYVSGATDLRIQQPFDQPYLRLRVERTKAEQLGFTAHDIAQNLLVSLSGSFQTSPSFWLDPNNHVSYQIATQTPQYRTDTLQDVENIPITGTDPNAPPSIMASLVSTQRGTGMAVVSDYNVAPVIDIFGSVAGRDLGGVAGDINKIITATRQQLPRGSRVVVRGQVQTMRASYIGLLSGLVGSIVLVYLLIVVNFQSWLDPFIMISALPAALAGIAWFLFITHTNLSVPALMGAIMCMGVATSNSIHHAHESERPSSHGSHHVHGSGNLKQHSGGELRYGKNDGRNGFGWCSAGGRVHAFSPRVDDRSCHDHRHGANGSRTWGWR